MPQLFDFAFSQFYLMIDSFWIIRGNTSFYALCETVCKTIRQSLLYDIPKALTEVFVCFNLWSCGHSYWTVGIRVFQYLSSSHTSSFFLSVGLCLTCLCLCFTCLWAYVSPVSACDPAREPLRWAGLWLRLLPPAVLSEREDHRCGCDWHPSCLRLLCLPVLWPGLLGDVSRSLLSTQVWFGARACRAHVKGGTRALAIVRHHESFPTEFREKDTETAYFNPDPNTTLIPFSSH